MANFRALVQSLVQKAIIITGDLAESIVYNSVSNPVYDPTTGDTTSTVVTYQGFKGIVGKFSQNEIDAKVEISTDAKLTVAFLDLPILPKVGDNLTVMGRVWKPVRVMGPPGGGSWTIHIRVT